MRVAEICPNCGTPIHSACVVWGSEDPNVSIDPLTTLDEALNTLLPALSGDGPPAIIANYVGQIYIDTSQPRIYVALSNTEPNWAVMQNNLITTTTTTTTIP